MYKSIHHRGAGNKPVNRSSRKLIDLNTAVDLETVYVVLNECNSEEVLVDCDRSTAPIRRSQGQEFDLRLFSRFLLFRGNLNLSGGEMESEFIQDSKSEGEVVLEHTARPL